MCVIAYYVNIHARTHEQRYVNKEKDTCMYMYMYIYTYIHTQYTCERIYTKM